MANQPVTRGYRLCLYKKSTMMIVDHHRAKRKEEESI